MAESDGLTTERGAAASLWSQLPDYDSPPVVETVMAAQFRPLRALDSVLMLEFWNEALRSEFSEAEQKPFYSAPIEEFGVGPPASSIRVQLPLGPEPLRYWFRSESGEDLAQVQHDWLAFNWRKPSDDANYRHYDYGRSRFLKVYDALDSFVRSRGIGALAPIQGEISYINHILSDEAGGPPATLDDVLYAVGRPREDGRLPEPESQTLTSQYLAHTDTGEPFARLHVQAQPAFSSATDEALVVLNMTFRGRTQRNDVDGVMEVLDAGHDWIVGGFDEITTDRFHEIWQRKERT